MNKIFNQILGLNSQPKQLAESNRIKSSGKTVDKLKQLASSKGLELYCCEMTKTYNIWKDGNSIEGTYDGFTKLSDVKEFLTNYLPVS